MTSKQFDSVERPEHYNMHPSGIECREITEYLNSNLANAFECVFRHNHKGKPAEDIDKALRYLTWELDRLQTDLTKTRFTIQPAHVAGINQKLIRIHRFEGLTRLKYFYKNFYLMLIEENCAIKQLGFCIEELTRYREWLNKKNA